MTPLLTARETRPPRGEGASRGPTKATRPGAVPQGRQGPRCPGSDTARPARTRLKGKPRGGLTPWAGRSRGGLPLCSPPLTPSQAEGDDLPCARAASASVAVQWEVRASGAAAGRAVSSTGSPEGKEPGTPCSPGSRVPATAPSGRTEPGRGRMTQGRHAQTQYSPEKPATPAGCQVHFRVLYQVLIRGLGRNGRGEKCRRRYFVR